MRKRPDEEDVAMGAVCVCSVPALVMDDGMLGYGSSIHTAAPPLRRGGGDCREIGVMWVYGAGCSSSLCAWWGLWETELISRIELRIINKHNDVSVCQ